MPGVSSDPRGDKAPALSGEFRRASGLGWAVLAIVGTKFAILLVAGLMFRLG